LDDYFFPSPLVPLLKDSKATIEELVKNINQEQKGISIAMVEGLLEYHGLLKKTIHTPCKRGSSSLS
jgi:hypothetical protein